MRKKHKVACSKASLLPAVVPQEGLSQKRVADTHLSPDFVKILNDVGITKWFPKDRIFPEEDEIFSATLRPLCQAVGEQG